MRRQSAILCVVVLTALAVACVRPSSATEISRERAIEIARGQVSFRPDSTEAVKVSVRGRAVWRVAFQGRLPGQPPPLFETVIVEIDRRSGEVVSIAKS